MKKSLLIAILSFSLFLFPSPFSQCQGFIFGGVSLKDEKEMGRKFEVMLRSHLPIIEDPEISRYVADLLKRLVRSIPPQPFEFRSSVALHNALNAFAAPGGYVCVFSGLIMNFDNEAQLAGLLAHELSHVTQRHMAARMERAQYLTLGSLLVAIAGIALGGPGGAAAAAGAAGAGQAAMLNYSRMDESEADNLGLQYLMAAGYPPKGMVDGFKVLRQKSWLSGSRVPTYLSTHPDIGDRVNSLSARIAAMPVAKRNISYDNTRFKRAQTLLLGRYGDEQIALRRLSGSDPLSLMGRGMVLSRLNRIPEAKQAFDAALAKAPNDALIMREAGIFHYRKGDSAEAEKLLISAVKKDRDDYMAAFFYARCLEDAGRHNEAIEQYKNVLRQVPEEADVHESYAKTLNHLGKSADAYIHMTYAAIYSNNKALAERYYGQAKKLSSASGQQRTFQQLEKVFKERKEVWRQG